jgi:hypothetical protein
VKKFIMGIVVGAFVMLSASAFADDGLEKIEAYLRPTLSITLNGEKVVLDNPPVMHNGSTHLHLRDMAKLTGLEVDWNDKTQTVEMHTDYVTEKSDSQAVNPVGISEETNESRPILAIESEISGLEGTIEATKVGISLMKDADPRKKELERQLREFETRLEQLKQEKADAEAAK